MRALLRRVRRSLAGGARRLHPDRELVAAEFDAGFYLAANPDVARVGADPLEHFLAHGWREDATPAAASLCANTWRPTPTWRPPG